MKGKLKGVVDAKGSSAGKYFAINYGPMPKVKAMLMELCVFLFGNMSGAAGLLFRSKLYRCFLGSCGKKLVVGRGVTLRHPSKIHFGDGVILDDNSVVDAKGEDNEGITFGNNVYIGKNSIVYCKNGNITLEDKVNISANCILFSSNSLTMRSGSMVGAYSYFLSGGEYDYSDPTPFAEQSGMCTKGPLEIGANCWFGTRVTVLDSTSKIGEHCVFAAGAVVTRPTEPNGLYVGAPAKRAKTISESETSQS